MERSAGGQATVPTEISDSIPGYRLNNPGGGIDFSNAIVEGIRNEEVPGTVGMHIAGNINCGVGGWTSIAAVARRSIPSDGLNVPRSRNHFPNALVEGIGNEDVTRTVDKYCLGTRECSTRGRTAVPAESAVSISCHSLNIPGGGNDFSNAIVPQIRYEDVTSTVNEHALGTAKCSVRGWAAVAAESKVSISCHSVNNPGGGIDFSDAVVLTIRNEDVPRTVNEHALGTTQCSVRGRAAV